MATSQEKSVVVRSGIGFPTLLFLVFLTLQLTGEINWPWYAVAAPLFIGWGGMILLMLLFMVLAVVMS